MSVGLRGLEKNREEVIAAGAIIIRTVMETLVLLFWTDQSHPVHEPTVRFGHSSLSFPKQRDHTVLHCAHSFFTRDVRDKRDERDWPIYRAQFLTRPTWVYQDAPLTHATTALQPSSLEGGLDGLPLRVSNKCWSIRSISSIWSICLIRLEIHPERPDRPERPANQTDKPERVARAQETV